MWCEVEFRSQSSCFTDNGAPITLPSPLIKTYCGCSVQTSPGLFPLEYRIRIQELLLNHPSLELLQLVEIGTPAVFVFVRLGLEFHFLHAAVDAFANTVGLALDLD